MKVFFQNLLLSLVVVSLAFPLPVLAEKGFVFAPEHGARGSEYISSDQPKSVLIQVTALGAINKAGLHYIPVNTDLLTFVALCGGIQDNYQTRISVKRRHKGKYQSYMIDLNEVLETGEKIPILRNGDIIHVPFREKIFSDTFVQVLTITTSILGLTVTLLALTGSF